MPSAHYLVPLEKLRSYEGQSTWDYAEADLLFGFMERDEIVGVYGSETFICVDYKGSRYLRNKGLGFVEWPDDFSADSSSNSCIHEE